MQDQNEQASTAIATTEAAPQRLPQKARLEADGGGVMAIVPRTLEEASRYSQGLIAAGQVPDAFRYDGKKGNDPNPALVLMGVLKVLELGMQPQTGLAFILPLNGRFTVWGDGAWALLQRAELVTDHKVEWLNKPDDWDKKKHETDLNRWPKDYGVRVSIWRKGQASPYVGEFTVGDAQRAGLWNSQYRKPWIQSPERMLFNRARAFPMRDGFADALLGLAIAEETLDHMPPPRRTAVDNSALDDDLPIAASLISDQSKAGDIDEQVAAYISGLAMISTLEDLGEYQTAEANRLLMAKAQRDDDKSYQAMIQGNAHRYQEIEAAEAKARKEAAALSDQAAEGAEASAEAPEGGEAGNDPPAAQQGDLLGGEG